VTFLAILAVAGFLAWLYRDEIRPLFFNKCKHRIPYESICVTCREKGDRRG
jgi:hypothetical protein